MTTDILLAVIVVATVVMALVVDVVVVVGWMLRQWQGGR